LYKML